MRKINKIIIHCTATEYVPIMRIVNYWKDALKWKSPGYHIIIDQKGKIWKLAEDYQICNGVKGHNKDSLHVAWLGGKSERHMTFAQEIAMKNVISNWHWEYGKLPIYGHNDFNENKECPIINVREFVKHYKLD